MSVVGRIYVDEDSFVVWTFKRDVVQWVAGCRMTTFAAFCLRRTALVPSPRGDSDGQYQSFLRSSPCLLLRHSCFCHLQQNHKFMKSLTHTGKCIIFAHTTDDTTKIYDWCCSDTILSLCNVMQICQSVISLPVIHMDEMNSRRKL